MAEKPKKGKRLSPEERRLHLLDEAVRVFADKGIGEAKHADVARAAGVSVATSFVYFPTREALVDGVLAYLEQELDKLLDWSPFEGQSVLDILENLAAGALLRAESHPHHMKLMLAWSTHFGEHVRPRFLAFQEKELDRLTAILASGRSAHQPMDRDDARMLNGVIMVFMQMKLDGESPEKLARFMRHAIAMVVAGSQGRPT